VSAKVLMAAKDAEQKIRGKAQQEKDIQSFNV
jgi:hypothetical protein